MEPAEPPAETAEIDEPKHQEPRGDPTRARSGKEGVVRLGGLVYNIQIQLPESRDPTVYDALFRSLKVHLLDE